MISNIKQKKQDQSRSTNNHPFNTQWPHFTIHIFATSVIHYFSYNHSLFLIQSQSDFTQLFHHQTYQHLIKQLKSSIYICLIFTNTKISIKFQEPIHIIHLMTIKYYLSVTIDNIEFAKDFQYFITVQYQNQKKRSDLSVNAKNPIFTCNTFLFPLENPHSQVTGIVTFTACVVLEEGLDIDSRGTSKILGEVDTDLYPLALQANQSFSTPMRQQLKFIRSKEGKQIPVGRFIALFKIVNESSVQEVKQYQVFKLTNNPLNNVPDYDPNFDFDWRVLAHIRSAENIPSDRNDDRGLTPQAFVEIGWSPKQGYPNKETIFKTNIIESNNPFWNSCFLINNPVEDKKDRKQRKGFICLTLKDQNSMDDVILFSIPVESMTPFVFYNLSIQEKIKKCNLIISLTLETPIQFGQPLYDIMITDVVLSPFPKNINKISLVLNTELETPKIQFYRFDRTKESITRLIQFDEQTKSRYFSYSISQVMRTPLKSSSDKNPIFVFTVPEQMINRDLTLSLMAESSDNHEPFGIPNNILAATESLSVDLQALLIKKTKKKIMVNLKPIKKPNNPLLLSQQCKLLISTHYVDQKQKTNRNQKEEFDNFTNKQSKLSTPHKQQSRIGKSMGLSLNEQENFNGSKLSTNNQIVNRLLKQLDQKNQAVKVAAAEVIDLRKQMKLMQSQNNILRHQATQGEQEIRELVSREISDLGVSELKEKIVKMAGMYKNQRTKVKQLENTIKILQPQVSGNMQLQSIIGGLQNKLKSLTSKQGQAKKELQRIGLYKDTIKKQQKVISKLQKVITDSMKDIKKAREDRLQLQEYRKNGFSHGRNNTNEEVKRLQKLVYELQQQINQKHTTQPIDQSQMQFRLYKAEQRCSALQEQISNTSKSYAKEVARLKLIIAEKQALLDDFTLDLD